MKKRALPSRFATAPAMVIRKWSDVKKIQSFKHLCFLDVCASDMGLAPHQVTPSEGALKKHEEKQKHLRNRAEGVYFAPHEHHACLPAGRKAKNPQRDTEAQLSCFG
jgi:hypothetical protein